MADRALLASEAGISLDYQVQTNWQPVDSQRLMLWAARFGKAELYMDALGHQHFECRKSASHSKTLLQVAAQVGLDVAAVTNTCWVIKWDNSVVIAGRKVPQN